ncbi:eCIS core domain-containing protein [Pollutibacter soli]|uniref:eCIS core domain-containing protein n=1 Tax=Pollutibacter soli TaxID=3034157 RepID=UPI00301399C4
MEALQVNIKENSWLAKLAAWKLGVDNVALTLGTTIHLHKASAEVLINDERWVRHELKHVEQFIKYGYFKFIFLYVMESLRKGYENNRFEVEAREAELVRC